MQIYINNQLAAIKQGSSFDYVAENRYFSGADSYTLAITFPLKDCPQNLAIFGHINRKDVATEQILFDCEIRDKAFVQYGSLTITEISETEVKCQFLEGRSVQNYDATFDEVYINELELGYPDTDPSTMVCDYPYQRDNRYGQGYLAFPWVNNNTGNIQNKWKAHHTLWADRVTGLSYQAYMWYLVELIFDNLGYTYNLSEWETHYKWGHLLCCNTLPYAWGIRKWARALPHWTLTEFLEQLELLMKCEFDIDHSKKTVTFSWASNNFLKGGNVVIDKVVEAFNNTPTKAEDSKYKADINLKYADCDHRMWKYMCCPAVIKKMYSLPDVYTRIHKDTVTDLTSSYTRYKTGTDDVANITFHRLYHVDDVDMDFALRIWKRQAVANSHNDYNYTFWSVWQSINAFGPTDPDAEDATEIKIVPAWLDEVINENKGVKRLMLFLDCPDMNINDGQNDDDDTTYDVEANKEELMTNFNSMPCYYAANSASDEKQEFFDKIYVAFWATYANGRYHQTAEDEDSGVTENSEADHNDFAHWPFPVRDCVEVDSDWAVYQNDEFSLRFDHYDETTNAYIKHIDPTQKYTFKWLADTIPNPRATFYINGRRFICEKITATFTENGMSQLLKGDFYPRVD